MTKRPTMPKRVMPASPALGTPRRNPMKIRADAGMYAAKEEAPRSVWHLPDVAPNVLPKNAKRASLAMDSWSGSTYGWALNGAFSEGLEFMGYPYLSELTQRAEYRRPAEIIAKAMTRKWIKFVAKGEDDKTDRIKMLEEAFVRYEVQHRFKELAEQDGFFGRSQLYLDTGYTDNPEELKLPLPIIPEKIGSQGLKRLVVVEPIWTYPNQYNSTDPLKNDFFVPETWFVMGKEVHNTRLLTFVSKPLPDILKPAYSFGGLSLSQMAKPYVDNWLRTRQAVSDLIFNFSITALKTNLSEVLNGGGAAEMFKRVQLFNRTRSNRGLMVLDKEMEDLIQVNAPLGSLDKLQAQTQEHMATVYGIPLIILFAITPTGLNASSDAELTVFGDWIKSQQESFFTKHLTTVMHAIELSVFGEIDPTITFEYVPLEQEDILELANVRKVEADTDAAYIQAGVIGADEARARLANQEDSQYSGLDLDTLPTPPDQMNAAIGDPFGFGEPAMADPKPNANLQQIAKPTPVPEAPPKPKATTAKAPAVASGNVKV